MKLWWGESKTQLYFPYETADANSAYKLKSAVKVDVWWKCVQF